MLTFEKLVQLTAERLSATNAMITPDLVANRLQDAGIVESLRQAQPSAQARLTVEWVHLAGEKASESGVNRPFTYERHLGSGLTAWIGANGSGKSTIMSTIMWALTGSDSGISKRVRGWLHEVIVHFTLGTSRYTSYIERTAEAIRGGIYQEFLSLDQIQLSAVPLVRFEHRDSMKDAIDTFFMQQLGISSLRWTAHSSAKDDPDLHAHSTTWRTYAHAIHIEDDSYDDLIIDPQKGFGRQDRKILEMMLGVEPARAVAEIQVQADFAKEAYARARSRVSGKHEQVQAAINQLQQECNDINQAVGMMQQDQTPVEDDSIFVDKRERRAALLAEQNQIAAQLAQLDAQRADMQADLLDTERAKSALQEQGEVEYLVNSLVVVRCPHCENAVDEATRMEQERAQHTCHVCAQPLTKTRSRGDIKGLVKERDAQLAALKAGLKKVGAEFTDLRQKLSASQQESAQIGKELETNVTRARQGFTESYATLLVRKGQAEGQLDQLRRSLTEIEAERHEVDTAANWHLILQTAAEIADDYVFKLYENAFDAFSKLVVHLATQFGVPDLQKVVIDEKRYVRLIQGGVQLSHTDLARSERVKFKVAFHLALMLLQVRAGLGKHPRFLLIDTPGTAEVNHADFVAMNRDLANIHAEYGDQVQILLATARPEAEAHLPSELVEKPSVAGRFF